MDTEGFAKVRAQYPTLTIAGFEDDDYLRKIARRTGKPRERSLPPSSDGTQICVEWLLGHDALDRRQSINHKASSYWWKHVVERKAAQYVSNGEFICAALYLGYKMEREGPYSLNAFFNIRNVKRS